MKVEINKELCIGCGACVAECGEIFEMGDDAKSQIKKDADLDKNQECIKKAAEGCPVQAISVK